MPLPDEFSKYDLIRLGAVKPDGSPDIADVRHVLPVPHSQMSIDQSVKVDETKDGKIKQPKRHKPRTISVTLRLFDLYKGQSLTWSADEQLAAVEAAFLNQASPIFDPDAEITGNEKDTIAVYSIQSRLTDAAGIRIVIFNGCRISDRPGQKDIDVELSFTEYQPPRTISDRQKLEDIKSAEHAALEDALGMSLTEEDVRQMELMSYDAEDAAAIKSSMFIDEVMGTEGGFDAGYRAARRAASRGFGGSWSDDSDPDTVDGSGGSW